MKVFCATYGGGHVNIIKCIYSAMLENKINTSILALTLADIELKEEEIPHKTISDYLFLMDTSRINSIGNSVINKIHNKASGIKERDSRVYYGIGIASLIDDYGAEGLKMYEKLGRVAFKPVQYMSLILKYEKPDVVLLTTGVRFEKALAIAANELNIPVVMVNDLPIMTNDLEFDANICVMNMFAKKDAISKGIPKEKIFVTGQPVMEKILKIERFKSNINKEKIYKNWKKVILYLGMPEIDTLPEGKETIDELSKIAETHKDWLIIIRPHPNNFDNYGIENTENLYVTKEGELKYVIDMCDIAITQGSTSGIEAAIIGKPVITYLNSSKIALELSSLGIAYNITNIDELEKNIIDLLDYNSLKYKKLELGRREFKNEKNSVENIIRAIKSRVKNEC